MIHNCPESYSVIVWSQTLVQLEYKKTITIYRPAVDSDYQLEDTIIVLKEKFDKNCLILNA